MLEAFSAEERTRIGIHTCPGGDRDSTHSADVDYAELLPDLFRIAVGNADIQLASEGDRRRVLRIIAAHARRDQRVFVGVTNPVDPRVETAEEVRDRVLEAAEFIGGDRLGTTDDCAFAPSADDVRRPGRRPSRRFAPAWPGRRWPLACSAFEISPRPQRLDDNPYRGVKG